MIKTFTRSGTGQHPRIKLNFVADGPAIAIVTCHDNAPIVRIPNERMLFTSAEFGQLHTSTRLAFDEIAKARCFVCNRKRSGGNAD